MPSTPVPEPRYCPECRRPISVHSTRCVRCAARHRAAAQRRFPVPPAPVAPAPILWPALAERQLRAIRRASPETDWGALAQRLNLSRAMVLAIRAELLRAPARPPHHDPTPSDVASSGQAAD